MKKLFIYLTLLALTTSTLAAQNAFWDAILLHNAREGRLGEELDSLAVADSAFFNSPFSQLPDTALLRKSHILLNTEGETILQSDPYGQNPELSTLSPTTLIIDGTARFLAERFREEATTLYLDGFRNRLQESDIASALLPKTTNFLGKANLFDIKALGTNFKDAFEEDLKQILGNLKTYLEGNEKTDHLDYYAMVFALDLCDQLLQGTHPVDLINYLDYNYEYKDGFEDYYHITHTINILQYNLRALEPETTEEFSLGYLPKKPIWVSFKDLRLLNTPEEVRYFLGLIYQQDQPFFENELGLKANTIDQRATEFWNDEIIPLIGILQQAELILKDQEISPNEYIPLFDAFLELVKWGNKTTLKPNGVKINLDGIEVLEKVVDVYQSIQTKSYAQLVTNGSWLIHRLLIESGTDTTKAVEVLEVVQRYGTFMVDIVTAENSEEVKDAIKRNVTKFSYLDKRRSPFSLTVMAVPSLLGGSEEIMGGLDGSWQGVGAVSCPIGFDLSFNFRKSPPPQNLTSFNPDYVSTDNGIKEPRKAVAGFYIGIIDLAAPFSYRFSGSSRDLPSDITLKQIVSPSASFHYSFRNSPITLAAGWQYTPELRTIGGEAENVNRLLLRCSWDIPLVKLSAKR